MSDTILICAFIVQSILAYGLYKYAFEKGRAFGWQEGYFQHIDRERARRDSLGRFKINVTKKF